MRIAIYARISTNGCRQDLNNQLIPLREWAERLEASSISEFIDEASGGKCARPGLNLLLESAHRREFDVVLVWALDRLSREGISGLSRHLERLKICGVRLLSHQEPWLDTGGPVAELITAVFGWIAQQERARISERVLAGLRNAKAKGKRLGRPKRLLNLEKAESLKQSGHTVREISQILGIPKTTVGRALRNRNDFNVLTSNVP